VAWNRAQHNDLSHEVSALQWSVIAMAEATDRLADIRALDLPRAVAAIGEAVWKVTIVDATLVRHYPDVYDQVSTDLPAAERTEVDGMLAGLRFIRNRLGVEQDLADFICTESGSAEGICGWAWRAVPAPDLDAYSARGQQWELTRYQAYADQLAGRPICDSFTRAAAFLDRVAGQAELISADVAAG
jgi:hypothetical protein